MEGKAQITDMLLATLDDVVPFNWTLEGEATGEAAMTECWFTFETAVARGRGQLRLKNGKAWTLLTTMVELKGHEEKKGASRIKGVEHFAQKNREKWAERMEREAKELGTKNSLMC